jgi:hypothetical protein
MKINNKHTKEFIEKVKEYYLNNDVSLQDMSDNSVTLFGKHIPIADLKFLSRSDVNGAWSVIKANSGRKTSDVPIQEKLSNVANKLYNVMFDEDSDLSATQLAQLAKTWSDLVDKAKLGKGESTAKTTSQQAKDLFEKTMAEMNKNG